MVAGPISTSSELTARSRNRIAPAHAVEELPWRKRPAGDGSVLIVTSHAPIGADTSWQGGGSLTTVTAIVAM